LTVDMMKICRTESMPPNRYIKMTVSMKRTRLILRKPSRFLNSSKKKRDSKSNLRWT
jgi:hypothetical protein